MPSDLALVTRYFRAATPFTYVLLLASSLHVSSFAQTWSEVNLLKATKQEINDQFGASVALGNNYAAVGTRWRSSPSSTVYLFKRNSDNSFEVIDKIQLDDPVFSMTTPILAMTDDVLVIGDPDTGQSYWQGTAMIYTKDNTGAWNFLQRLSPSDHAGGDRFGSAVAISENTIVISSPGKSIEYHEGAIYVFERDGMGLWIEKQKIMSSDSFRDDEFGGSLAIEGTTIIAGAPYENNDSPYDIRRGAAYVIGRDANGTWIERQKLVSPNRDLEDTDGANFGYSVDISGSDVIIGANNDTYRGAAYFFAKEDNAWTYKQRVAYPDSYSFGSDVAIADGHAVVTSSSSSSQFAFPYIKDATGKWTETEKIYGPSFYNHSYESFGVSIDINKNMLIIGAPTALDSTEPTFDYSTGEAHVYVTSEIPVPFQKTTWFPRQPAYWFYPQLVDVDNDGDLDIFTGYIDDDVSESRLYLFDEGNFSLTSQRFPVTESNTIATWIDANGDGWLDLIVGYESQFKPKIEIYVNNHDHTFTPLNVTDKMLADRWRMGGDFHFADFDNDADLDMLIQLKVETGEEPKVTILQNNGAFSFTATDLIFGGTVHGQPWADYNNDGLIDFVISRRVTCEVSKAIVFRNKGNRTFEEYNTQLTVLNSAQFAYGDLKWRDFDNDGFTDIFWSGNSGCSSNHAGGNVLMNINGEFRNGPDEFPKLYSDVQLAAIDFSNDGATDLVAYGRPETGLDDTKFYLGDNNTLKKMVINETPQSSQGGGIATGDIDNDGDLDVVISGTGPQLLSSIVVYRNNAADGWTHKNLAPSSPAGVKVITDGNTAKLTWLSSTDDSTPKSAITYNVQVIRNDSIVVSAGSRANGLRQVQSYGNAGRNLALEFRELKDGSYKAVVQALDASLMGSAFSSTVEFEINTSVTGLEEQVSETIQLYPNPTNSFLTVASKGGKIDRVILYDVLGKTLQDQSGTSDNVSLSVKDLDHGVYVLCITTKGVTVRKRFVRD